MHEVRPGLFIGSLDAAEDRQLLSRSGITHILTMNGDRPCFPHLFRYEVKRTRNEDRARLLEYLPQNIAFIRSALEEEPRGKVLVHCTRGVNRSGSMVVAYLMWKEGLSFERALREARQARPQIEPRAGMVDQLRIWQHILQQPGDVTALVAEHEEEAHSPFEVVRSCLRPLLADVINGKCRRQDVLLGLLRYGKFSLFSRTAFEEALRRVAQAHRTAAEQAQHFPDEYLRAMARRQQEKLGLTTADGERWARRRQRDWLEVLAAQCRLRKFTTAKVLAGRSPVPHKGPTSRSRDSIQPASPTSRRGATGSHSDGAARPSGSRKRRRSQSKVRGLSREKRPRQR